MEPCSNKPLLFAGNNGTTVTAAVLANKLGLSWPTKEGVKRANYYGSVTQASTVCLGQGAEGDVYIPFKDLLPMCDPNTDIEFDGKWHFDIDGLVQERRNYSVLAMELRLPCTNP